MHFFNAKGSRARAFAWIENSLGCAAGIIFNKIFHYTLNNMVFFLFILKRFHRWSARSRAKEASIRIAPARNKVLWMRIICMGIKVVSGFFFCSRVYKKNSLLIRNRLTNSVNYKNPPPPCPRDNKKCCGRVSRIRRAQLTIYIILLKSVYISE